MATQRTASQFTVADTGDVDHPSDATTNPSLIQNEQQERMVVAIMPKRTAHNSWILRYFGCQTGIIPSITEVDALRHTGKYRGPTDYWHVRSSGRTNY